MLEYHDVRKDPADLPEAGEQVICCGKYGSHYMAKYDGEIFIHPTSHTVMRPIAWCRFPRFDHRFGYSGETLRRRNA